MTIFHPFTTKKRMYVVLRTIKQFTIFLNKLIGHVLSELMLTKNNAC